MNNRIPSGSLSVVADAKEIMGSSPSSGSSKIQEERSAEGISIKLVDHSNLHALESRSSTPPSNSSDRNSSSEKETSSTNTLGIYVDEGSLSDDSNAQVPHLNNANMSNRPQAAVGSRRIDVTADAKLIRSHQQDQKKEVIGEEAPETDW